MDNTKKFIKSSAIYFVGNVLTKIITFFLLPIYTNYIATADMGYYDLSVSYLNILIPVLCMDIWSGIMRFMFDYNEKEGKYKVIFNGSLIFLFSVTVYSIAFLVLGFATDIRYLAFIFFYGLFTMVQTLYTYLARGLGYNTVFALSGILGGLMNSILNIVLILYFGLTLESLYISMIAGLILQIIVMESRIHLIKNFSFDMFDKKMIKNMLRFSLPLCLNSACFWFLSSYNHVGISNTLGLEANGLYSIAAKFTIVLGLVSNCFSMAWQELVYSKGNEQDKSEFYTIASNYYIKFLMMAILLFIPAINVIFPYFIGPEYQDSFSLVPLYLLATAASIFSFFLGNIFGAEKKTGIVFYSTVIAAAVNVGLLHLLIGTFGIQAANISLLCGFVVNILIRIVLLRRSVKIKIDYFVLVLSLALFAAGWYVYSTQGALLNILYAIVVAGIFAFIFRDLIKIGFNFLKSKIALKSNHKEI